MKAEEERDIEGVELTLARVQEDQRNDEIADLNQKFAERSASRRDQWERHFIEPMRELLRADAALDRHSRPADLEIFLGS